MCRRRYAYKSVSLQVTAVQMDQYAHIRILWVSSIEHLERQKFSLRTEFFPFNRLHSFCTEDRAYIVLVFGIIIWSVFLILKDILKTRTAVTEVLDLCPLIGDGFQDFLVSGSHDLSFSPIRTSSNLQIFNFRNNWFTCITSTN